jgi:hypothetical protein
MDIAEMVSKIRFPKVAIAIHTVATQLRAWEFGLVVNSAHVLDVFCRLQKYMQLSALFRGIEVVGTPYLWAPTAPPRNARQGIVFANVMIIPDVLREVIFAFETMRSPILLTVFAGKAFGVISMFSLMSLIRVRPREFLLATILLTDKG